MANDHVTSSIQLNMLSINCILLLEIKCVCMVINPNFIIIMIFFGIKDKIS